MLWILRRKIQFTYLKILAFICLLLILLLLLNYKPTQDEKLTNNVVVSIVESKNLVPVQTEIKSNDTLNCPPEYQTGIIEPKEFFIFKTGMVWCNVFKSASTSVLNIMGLLDGISEKKLKSMNPVVSVMRNIYGRPSLEQIIAASKREK